MKKIYSLLIAFTICLSVNAQVPSFTITNLSNSFSITCNTPTISLALAPNNYTYTWVNSPPTFTSNATLANLTTGNLGNYTVTATNTLTGISSSQTFAIGQNTFTPSNTLTPINQTISCNSLATFTSVVSSSFPNVSTFWFYPGSTYTSVPSVVNNGTISIAAIGLPGTTTVLTINNINGCTNTKTLTVTSTVSQPTFNILSSTNFSIGACGLPSTTLCFIGAANTGSMTGPIQYAFLPPTSTLSIPIPTANFGSTICTNVTVGGNWTMVGVNPVNNCQTAIPVVITQYTSYADFTYTVNPSALVNFSSTSVGTASNTTYIWNFGDGSYASGLTASHTYSAAGNYTATLTNNFPSCAAITKTINVTPPCAAISNFTVVPTSTAQVWYAAPTSFSNVTSALWSWGDGSTSNTLYPSHSYSAAGLYNICLTVTTTCASTSSTCTNYNIFKSIDASQAMVTINVVSSIPNSIRDNTLDANLFSVYPNPATNVVYIANKHNQNATIKVFNIEGSEVKTLAVEANTSTKLEGLSNGIYFLEVTTEGKILRKKLVVLGD